ncbi:D-glycero-alpha-D-manno-heptose-1,7-bisphosphate 7-phosphatase [Ferrimonas futtsuensis]|uniref:D-glycero-alpha-D-manno-heptose-1,7-bisphosphate 7-phosphatase n=1 Tax=Ferrimonas futtsuensis TaxID=364764 RepID=UPI0009FD852A|nr:HAD family hydrolase [Ferrimonas futtsuensis]
MQDSLIKVAFLDRDGVINKEVNYLFEIKHFEFTHKCIDALNILGELGYKIIVVTNQAGIARGFYTEHDYKLLTNWYLKELQRYGVEVLAVYHCPHHPEGKVAKFAEVCNCRKPAPGMINAAMRDFEIDLKNSIIVGDKESDCVAGARAGVGKQYLVNSGHVLREQDYSKYEVYDNLYQLALSLR